MMPGVHLSSAVVSCNAINIDKPIQKKRFPKYEKYINNPNLWHKIVVYTSNLQRNFVLETIMKYVHPFDFIPVCYSVQDRGACFFLRNCSDAVRKLYKDLCLPHPTIPNQFLNLKITLGFSTTDNCEVNVEDNILCVLEKRFDTHTKVLDLQQFHEDTGLNEYCVLCQPQILNYILHLSRKFDVHHVNLQNNNIYSLNRVPEFADMKNLQALDLQNNLIEDLQEISIIIQAQNLSSLFLKGNPIYNLYSHKQFNNIIHQRYPSLILLDGFFVTDIATNPNFVCNDAGCSLVDQFLEHYFTLFDGPFRNYLGALYDSNSVFSFSSEYRINMIDFILPLAEPNYLDLRNADKYVAFGPTAFNEVVKDFPKTKHDPYSFTVDLVYYSDDVAILTVTGRLRQLAKGCSGAQGILHFARTFILIKKEYNEYKILNDVWVVTNPTALESGKFITPRSGSGKPILPSKLVKSSNLIASNKSEKHVMHQAFGKITGLTLNLSKRFLEEYEYNLLNALKYFVEMYERDCIPPEGFTSEFSSDKQILSAPPAAPNTLPQKKKRRIRRKNRVKLSVMIIPDT